MFVHEARDSQMVGTSNSSADLILEFLLEADARSRSKRANTLPLALEAGFPR